MKAWLIRVTTNYSRKHFNQYWNKNVSFLDETEEIVSEETGYEMVEEGNFVWQAVRRLPEKYRVVVHLFYFEELSVAQIASATKQKETTVKSQLFRAREMLKTSLEGEIVL